MTKGGQSKNQQLHFKLQAKKAILKRLNILQIVGGLGTAPLVPLM
jgi:hypothetical protein